MKECYAERMIHINSAVIDWIRFPLAIFVVIHHSFGPTIDFAYNNITDLSWYDRFRCAFSHVLVHIDNPVFFFISGYLFFLNINTNIWWREYVTKLKKRCKSILFPYLLWNMITAIILIFPKLLINPKALLGYSNNLISYHIFWDFYVSRCENIGPLALTYDTFTPINGPLWFLRDLFIMILLSPFLYFIIKRLGLIFIAICTSLFFSNIWYPICGLSIAAVLFYSLGAYFSINRKSFVLENFRLRAVLYTMCAFLFMICFYYDGLNTSQGEFIYPPYVLIASFASLNVAYDLTRKNVLVNFNKKMRQHCFVIYAGHNGLFLVFVVSLAFSKVSSILPSSDLVNIIIYILSFIIVSILCLFFSLGLKKMLPRVYNVLTGNR